MAKARVSVRIVLLVLLCTPTALEAAKAPGGAIIVRLSDGAPDTCIDVSKHAVSLHLRRAVVNKDIGLFAEDKEVGFLFSTVIEGFEGTEPRKVAFPRMLRVAVKDYEKGRVSLPIEMKVFNNFRLLQGGMWFDSASVEFAVLKKKSKAPFGAALSALADITMKLPAPINPFSEGFKFFAEYASTAVEKSLGEANNVDEQVKLGKIEMSFSTDSTCTGDEERTGTFAVITGSPGREQDGFVDITQESTYCWRAELKPLFMVLFARLPQGRECGSLDAKEFLPVRNPYLGFFLNASAPPSFSAPEVEPLLRMLRTTGTTGVAEAKERCAANGLSRDECF